jgi:UDP-N-acetylglucosamine 4-epimerase
MYDTPFHDTDISKSSFLITGGAGFIGSNLAEYLLKYKAGRVVVLDNLSTGFRENIRAFESQPNFQFIEGDICNMEDCKAACLGIDYLLHQAALGSVPRSIENPIATHNANATGFVNMLLAARDAKVKRVVYASSSSVYGDSKELPKKEENIGKPLSPYAVSKLVNEFYADIFSRTYQMEIIGLRYFNIFGPRQNPKGAYAAAIPLFIDALVKNKEVFINGDGEQTRDFTFVENAVQANIKALFTTHTKAIGSVFNIAVSEKITVNHLFQSLKKLTHSSLDPSYREQRPGDVRESLADISKARNILGYEPTVTVEKGLEITVQQFPKP